MTERENKIFEYWEADLQLLHDWFVKGATTTNDLLISLDKLKIQYKDTEIKEQ